jgi:uncharacterized protein YyaL (SSP411 family)
MNKPASSNHLTGETSPYLQQHAHNPVDWHPWNNEALNKARKENKPILLSIGYAACHWCHVMAQESFANPETAKLMNDNFINIKVDREERPDLDKIYQAANFLLTQRSGGWPLTVFLSPDDLTPFYSGTYFPSESRHNLPAFNDVLRTVADIFKQQQHTIIKQNEALRKALNYQATPTAVVLSKKLIDQANKTLDSTYDAINGGFGNAPKFTHPTSLEFLLRESSPLVTQTLHHMANGGIYDQLSGGFFRYSTDAEWHIPHFEKMLYDNAQLLYLYAESSRRYGQPFFAKIARKTGTWVLKTMQAPDGGYYSSLDADSEHEEGKYYLWNRAEIDTLLTTNENKIISLYYGLDKPPNFENHWHFYIAQQLDSVATHFKLSPIEVKQLIASSKQKLLTAREKRIPPRCDNKILTAWNSLMIKALMSAGDTLQEETFIHSAARALNFIEQNLWLNKRLFATYQNGKARFAGYLDDYAFLLQAVITTLQTQWQTKHIHFAIDLAESLLNHFYDHTAGGFYFTANDHEQLLHRPKSMMDEAIPAGNGIAAHALLTLGYLLGKPSYIKAAEKTITAAWPTLSKYPSEHSSLLLALENLLDPPQIVIIRGNIEEIKSWERFCKKQLNTLVFAIPNLEQNLPGLLATHKGTDKPSAFLCKGTQCLAKTQDFAELQRIITKHNMD